MHSDCAPRTNCFPSMRAYLGHIRERDLVRDVTGADWRIEIGTLTELVAFSQTPFALLFDDIAGYPTGRRVATNLYCTEQLQAIALGLPDQFTGIELVRKWRERSAHVEPRPPRVVADGPVRENIDRGDAVDLTKFPVPLW